MGKTLGKIIDGNLHLCSDKERKILTITNPSEEILRFVSGYKEVHYDEIPEYDTNQQYLNSIIEEDENNIIIHWEIKEFVIDDDI